MTSRPAGLVLLGHPVAHSLSPVFQNAALKFMGIPITYEALDVGAAELEATVDRLVRANVAGNITVPHKTRMAQLCGRLSADAKRAGAVNTFFVDDDGTLAGDCTDADGFEAMAHNTLKGVPEGARVALLGAGGGAAAVLTALERWNGCEVTLWNRSRGRADALAERFSFVRTIARSAELACADAQVVVNATTIGMKDDAHPVRVTAILPGAAVLDLVYRRGETAWVRSAREHGHRASDGLPMLLEQGAMAFERWFGLPAPRDIMRDALAHELSPMSERPQAS